jgi:exosortase/archaeosortase family protein
MTTASTMRIASAPRTDVRRIAMICGLVLLALWSIELSATLRAWFVPLNLWTAQVTAALLAAIGLPVARDGTLLLHAAGFAAEIDYRCTALLPGVLLAAAVLGQPFSPRARLGGVVFGVALLFVINALRLVHLFWLGVRAPEYLVPAHLVLWPAILILAAFAYWIIWRRVQTPHP